MNATTLEGSTQLELPDLQKLLELLSLAATRGAFDLEQFEDVGRVARKLSAFLRGAGDAGSKLSALSSVSGRG